MVNKYDSDNFTSTDSDNDNISTTSEKKSNYGGASTSNGKPSTSNTPNAENPITPEVLKYIKMLLPKQKPKPKVKKPKEIITPKVLTDEVINYLKQMSLESTKNHDKLQSKAPKTLPKQSFEASKKEPRVKTPQTAESKSKTKPKPKPKVKTEPKPKPKPPKRDKDMPQIFNRLDI